MSSGRLIAAAIVGGLVMFMWGAVAHMGLQLDKLALKTHLPGEEMIVPALKFSIEERGAYFFPGRKEGKLTDDEKKAWEEKYRAGPRGLLIYDPAGGEPMSMSQLGIELASNILAALFVAVMVARVGVSFFLRSFYATLIGIIGWLSIDVSYWNWYRFPTGFASASLIEQTVGWMLTGIAIAFILGGKKTQPKPL